VTGALGTQQRASGAPPGPSTRSLLVADCGSVFTKVALLGLVDGRYRLLATSQTLTTGVPPHADILQGILAGISELEHICTRTLLRDGRVLTPEQENGDGVDGMTVTVSVGGPLRLLTAGPGREALAALVHRATGGLFAALEPLPVDLGPAVAAGAPPEWERQMARLRTLRPHAVLVVGNALEGQRGRPDLEETGRALAALIDGLRASASESGHRLDMPVVFAGLPPDGVALGNALAGRAVLQTLDPLSPNTLTPLSRSVAGLYENAVLRAIPGYDRVRSLGATPVGAVATSLAGMVRGLAQHYQMNVVGVDVGASSTLLIGATAQGHVLPAAHPEAGVGPGLGAILRAVGAANVMRWISEPIEEPEVREYALKRMLRPRLLPATERELEMEHAFTREAIMLAMRSPGSAVAGLQPMDVVLGTGGVLAHAPRLSDAALLLLDAIQPGGITSIVLDSAQLAGMLGGLSAVDPIASGEVAESDAVVARLGSVVSTVGSVQPGHAAVRVVLEYTDGRRHVADVQQGKLARLPLHDGERAHLSLYPAPTVDIGLGPGQQARASEPVDGGLLDLIVDARGRPLTLPQNDEERRAQLREWRQAIETEA
jgi:MutL protein